MSDDLWSAFPLDPRHRAHADLRASDQDRERITAVLSSAFADGRLEHDELEERMSSVAAARTLGELPPLVADLVPLRPPPPRPSKSLVGLSHEQIHDQAVERWADRRRAATFSLLSVTAVAVGVQVVFGLPWFFIVNAVVLLHFVRVVVDRRQIVRDEVRRLEKKQARQQRWPKSLS